MAESRKTMSFDAFMTKLDMSFVYTELVKNYCNNNSRTADDTIRMFRYLLLKVICDCRALLW